jgi:hypothetical protein
LESDIRARILCLHINQHVTTAPLDEDGKKLQQSPRTLSIGFDCSIVTTSPSNEFDEYRARLTRLAALDSAADTLFISYNSSDANIPPSKGYDECAERGAQLAAVEASGHTLAGGKIISRPTTLYICHESRALALQRYKPAFGRVQLDAKYDFFCNDCYELGDNSAWDKAIFREPKIWVDFEQDAIVVDSYWERKVEHYPNVRFPEQAPFSPLSLIKIFAEEESKNIRRLGVAARYSTQMGNDVINVLLGRRFRSPIPVDALPYLIHHIHQYFRKERLLGFDNLEEIMLDDVPHRGYHREIPG